MVFYHSAYQLLMVVSFVTALPKKHRMIQTCALTVGAEEIHTNLFWGLVRGIKVSESKRATPRMVDRFQRFSELAATFYVSTFEKVFTKE